VKDGWSLIWTADQPHRPLLKHIDGTVKVLDVVNDVPVIAAPAISGGSGSSHDPPKFVSGNLDDQIPKGDAAGGTDDLEPSGAAEALNLTERLRREATSIRHQLTHLPKNAMCKVCQIAKSFAKPSRRKLDSAQDNSRGVVPCIENFGDQVRADHVVMRGRTEGQDGQRSALVLQDVATGFVDAFPAPSRTTEECHDAMREFIGKAQLKSLYSDNAPELIALGHSLQIPHATSTPYRHQTNSRIERAIGVTLQLARAILLQSGLELCMWPQALRYAALCNNVREDGTQPSAWERRYKEQCSIPLWPFGSVVHYRDPTPIADHKFAATMRKGIYVGVYMNPGGGWYGDHVVVDFENYVKPGGCRNPLTIRTKEIYCDPTPKFPLFEAREAADVEKATRHIRRLELRDVAVGSDAANHQVDAVEPSEFDPQYPDDDGTVDTGDLDPV
jgi:hypothetical protein